MTFCNTLKFLLKSLCIFLLVSVFSSYQFPTITFYPDLDIMGTSIQLCEPTELYNILNQTDLKGIPCVSDRTYLLLLGKLHKFISSCRFFNRICIFVAAWYCKISPLSSSNNSRQFLNTPYYLYII